MAFVLSLLKMMKLAHSYGFWSTLSRCDDLDGFHFVENFLMRESGLKLNPMKVCWNIAISRWLNYLPICGFAGFPQASTTYIWHRVNLWSLCIKIYCVPAQCQRMSITQWTRPSFLVKSLSFTSTISNCARIKRIELPWVLVVISNYRLKRGSFRK